MRPAYKSIQVFKNPLLEKLTHVHPLTPLVCWVPVSVFLLWHASSVNGLSMRTILMLGALGMFAWTLAEYVLHRFIFHYEPRGNKSLEFVHFVMHGMHHADPVDPTRLVMSPVAGAVLAVIFYAIFRPIFGPMLVEPFFAFFVIGYLCYDYIHYSVHHFKPRSRIGTYLKQSHMMHHYVSQESRWGVSSPLWDWVFGTLKETTPSSASNGVSRVRHGS